MSSPSPASANRIACTQCGGENELVSGRRLMRCQYCDATLFVDRGGVVNHYRLPSLLGADEAQAALRRWMAGNRTVKDLDKKSVMGAITAVSFPMWLFRVRRAGREEAYVEPAAPTPIPQLADLKVPAGKLQPYSVEGAGVEALGATIPMQTARGWLEQRGVGEPEESALVQVPLWRCSYSYEGRTFEALVDGSTGAVMASVFPEKAESPYVLVAILGLLLFTLEGLLITHPLIKFLAYGITAVPLLFLAWWVTRKI
jgi:hypothetical protein